MNQTVIDLQQQFRQLRLAETADALSQILREAEKASWTYLEFFEAITRHEREKRETRSEEPRTTYEMGSLPFFEDIV